MDRLQYSFDEIRERLCDDESRQIFDVRIEYMLTGDYLTLCKNLTSICRGEWKTEILGNVDRNLEFVLYGYGGKGKAIYDIMKLCGYNIKAVCDKNASKYDAGRILTVDDALKEYSDAFFIIGSSDHEVEMRGILQHNGIEIDHIIFPRFDKWMHAYRGNQYFDLFSSKEVESFVDLGGYDGETSISFIKWAKNYDKIWCFEPIASSYEKAKKRLNSLNNPNISVIKAAGWNKKERLRFDDNDTSSTMDQNGNIIVEAMPVDDVVGESRVSFIKMDIEGSELQALEGAKKVILRDTPRLAICVYHKPGDILTIPHYILSLNEDYKFYLRHYTDDHNETVLYATVE